MTSGTLISYLHLCHRKLWLHHHGMRMEHNSQAVGEGKLISETAYPRRASRWRELDLGNVKIDHYDPSTNTVREVKKSPKLEHAHIAQVKYYLYMLEQKGLGGASGIIEYPKQRKTTSIPPLTENDRKTIHGWEAEVARITALPTAPPVVKKSYCKTCAFYEFCYV